MRPTCVHGQVDINCQIVCSRCGHECGDHMSPSLDLEIGIPDCIHTDDGKYNCLCSGFTTESMGIEAMAEAIADGGGS